MISVKLSTNDTRRTIIVDEHKTIREVLEENDINYATTAVLLDGATLQPGQIDKTFNDYDITSNCIISTVVKTANA